MEFRNEIRSVDDWFKVAPPKGKDKQWKDGYSAKELAKYIVEENHNRMPAEIREVIKSAEIEDDFYCWVPEYITGLPGRGGGRNHDLAIISNSAFIGVEAKVNEPYGDKIGEWLGKGGENGKNREKRLNALYRIITGNDDVKKVSNYKELRYQLFSGLAGTIIEAKKQGKKKAVFLVIDFLIDCDEENEQNRKDFEEFCKALKISNKSSKDNKTTFFKRISNTEIEAYIAKILVKKKGKN